MHIATGFDFATLMAFAIGPIADDEDTTQAKLDLGRDKGLSFLVVKKVIRGKLLGDGHLVDYKKVLPFIVIEVGEAGVPTPLTPTSKLLQNGVLFAA